MHVMISKLNSDARSGVLYILAEKVLSISMLILIIELEIDAHVPYQLWTQGGFSPAASALDLKSIRSYFKFLIVIGFALTIKIL